MIKTCKRVRLKEIVSGSVGVNPQPAHSIRSIQAAPLQNKLTKTMVNKILLGPYSDQNIPQRAYQIFFGPEGWRQKYG